LYVRRGVGEARRLENVVAPSGESKRQLFEDAARAHLADGGLAGRRAALGDDPSAILTVAEAARSGTSSAVAAAFRGAARVRR
jgi:hypothetical protein